MISRMRVAIVHPWFPQYRVGFFRQLVEQAELAGIEISIFHGDPPPEWQDRNDGSFAADFTRLPTRFFRVRGRTLSRKSLKPIRAQGPFDLVIVEQAVRNIETYELLLSRTPLAYWGHGRTYTVRVGATQERLKLWLTRRGLWFFAYTEAGLDAVVERGFPQLQGTVVQNSIDTSLLRAQISEVRSETVLAFGRKHDLRGKTGLFIGGLDSSKRLGFLLDAARIAHHADSDFRLLIAGDGSDRAFVENKVQQMPFVSYLGSIFDRDKAVAISASQVLTMPGRVGLVSVDSFAGATPIVTTLWEWHAPEFEYLQGGVNAVITANDVDLYARELIATLSDVSLLSALGEACKLASQRYTVEAMVSNFLGGVEQALRIKK